MRIAIHTLGTRGDVEPYLALARGLRIAGHEPLLVAPAQFSKDADRLAIPFHPLPGGFLEILDRPEGQAIADGRQSLSGTFRLLKTVRPLMLELFDAEWAACRAFAPDVILHHPKALAAPLIGAALGIPVMLASPLPGFTPTALFPSPMLPFASLGPLNRLSHSLIIHAPRLIFGRTIGRWRQKTLGGAAPRGMRRAGTLYAYSPAVVPVDPAWGEDVCVSGYWQMTAPGWTPDAALAAFLADGPPPVYIGFGSMKGSEAGRLTETIVAAVRRAGCRAVLSAGWGGLGEGVEDPAVHVIGSVPHSRLFPSMAAVVHHGGAGTTGAGLAAGKPTLICPVFGDQPFWGRRVATLGAGPEPIARRKLDSENLAAVLRQLVTVPAYRQAAAAIGEAIRAEDGIGTAIDFIERRVRDHSRN